MKIWKLFAAFAMSMLLVAMLAACGGAASTPTTAAPTSVPTTAAPTSAPTTAAPQGAGGCTTVASCQKAVVIATPNQVTYGGKVTVTGKGWIANAKLTVSIGYQVADSDFVTTTSDAQGNFSAILTIKADTTTVGITAINVILLNDTTDGSKNLKVTDKLTLVQFGGSID